MVVLLAQAAEAAQAKLEPGAGEVWRYVAITVIPFLIGVIGFMGRHILKEDAESKLEAKEREKRLQALVDRQEGRS